MNAWPNHLLSLEEFERLPEDNSRRYELKEGVLYATPKAAGLHRRVVGALISILTPQLVGEWEAVPDVEVVLVQAWPPTLRIPDVVVVSSALIDKNPNRVHAQDVILAIEVVSPGSARTGRVYKAYDYAAAGTRSTGWSRLGTGQRSPSCTSTWTNGCIRRTSRAVGSSTRASRSNSR